MKRDQLVERLRREPGLVAAYLFGSQARGDAGPRSDIDIAIWLRARPTGLHDAALDLGGDLAAIAGAEVDVVVMNAAPSDLIHRVLRDGKLLVELDRSLRVQLEVAARRDFFDMIPIRNAYRRSAHR